MNIDITIRYAYTWHMLHLNSHSFQKWANHHIQRKNMIYFQLLSYHLNSHSYTHIAYYLLQSK